MSRKIMIGCGAVFLIALMLVCAFSLGVYAAERGITQSISTRAAQGTPSALRIPAAGTPNLLGVVQRYGDNTLTLTTAQGPRTIAVNAQTIVRRENDTAQFADLRPGVAIAVWGDPGEDRRTIVARVIVILEKTTKDK
jgi:hypothetical protein